MSAPPLLVLGVRRSGTTLLRVVLDRHSELAVPDESYFVPQLADRHGGRIDADGFVDDLRRLPTLREWGVSADAVRPRLRPGMGLGEAVGAVYEAYADGLGKSRWGDKTPMYMQHLPLLERLFPTARYVHLVRDGRDAGLSFLAMPRGIVTESWGHPRTPGGFACQWRSEVRAAQALGGRVGKRYLEVSYEELVADSAAVVERICAFAGLPYEPAMLEYEGTVDVSAKPHQQRLRQAPTPGVRDWREDMAPEDVTAFEAVAGDLLAELGYETATRPAAAARARGRAALAAYA
ncbi:MAG: sulfotransferase family protein, partial [Gaiellaceae bacterium]